MSAGAEAVIAKRTRQPNPVYEQLTRRRKWPSVRVAVMLCIALSVAGAIGVSIGWRPHAPGVPAPGLSSTSYPAVATTILSLITVIIAPFFCAALTAVIASRFANDEAFTMLKLTNVSPGTVIRGLLMAALFRLRLVWAICFGLLIPLVAAWTIIAIEIQQVFAQIDGGVAPPITRADILSALGGAAQIVLIGAAVGIILNWLAICIGIWVGLRWHKPSTALTISQVGVLISIIALWLIVGGWTYINVRFLINVDTFLPLRVLIVLLAFVYPFGGVALLNSARSRLWQ